LDNSLAELKVSSYGVMDTSLEEIFLKVTEAACQEEESTEDTPKPADALSLDSIPVAVTSTSGLSGENFFFFYIQIYVVFFSESTEENPKPASALSLDTKPVAVTSAFVLLDNFFFLP
jgi:hypothetical protein